MFNQIGVFVVSPFAKAGSEADKNGIQNVYLKCIAGKVPNKALVVAGTVAQRAGMAVGQTLLIMVDEREPDAVYGRQFNHTVLGEVKPQEILGLRKDLGEPTIVDVNEGTTAGTGNILEGNTQPAANTGATPAKVDLQSGLDATPVVAPVDTTAVVVGP